jgi:hypothetical protein
MLKTLQSEGFAEDFMFVCYRSFCHFGILDQIVHVLQDGKMAQSVDFKRFV